MRLITNGLTTQGGQGLLTLGLSTQVDAIVQVLLPAIVLEVLPRAALLLVRDW